MSATDRVALIVDSSIVGKSLLAGKQYNSSESLFVGNNHLHAIHVHHPTWNFMSSKHIQDFKACFFYKHLTKVENYAILRSIFVVGKLEYFVSFFCPEKMAKIMSWTNLKKKLNFEIE